MLASPTSWLVDEDEDPDPQSGPRDSEVVSSPVPWEETWLEEAVAGDLDGFDLIVAPPWTTIAALHGWRSEMPRVGLLLIAEEEDARLEEFFGDEGVFFLYSPPNRDALRSGIREVLGYRAAHRELREDNAEAPALDERNPVRGWLELTAPNHPVFLRRFRAWLEALEALPLSRRERNRLVHAIREVGWNAIEWGNSFDTRRRLELSFLALDDRILFRIQDEGAGSDWYGARVTSDDPAELQKRRADDGVRPGGLGLRLVEAIVDRVEVSSHGNTVILEKALPARARSTTSSTRWCAERGES